jgi:hypothetical protein
MAGESEESGGFFVGLGSGFEDGFKCWGGEGGFDVFEAFEGWSDAGEGGVFLGDEIQSGGAFGEVNALGNEPIETVGEVGGGRMGLDESEDLGGVGTGVGDGGAKGGAFFFGFGFDDAEGIGADGGFVGVDARAEASGFLSAGEGLSRYEDEKKACHDVARRRGKMRRQARRLRIAEPGSGTTTKLA